MKFTRVLAFVLVAVMAAFCFASCGAKTTTVTLKINCGDAEVPVILDRQVAVEGNGPSVLQALITGCNEYDMEYTLTEDEESVLDIGEYANYVDEETNTTYYWYFTVNGKEPDSRAIDCIVAEGDVVEYVYTSFTPDN